MRPRAGAAGILGGFVISVLVLTRNAPQLTANCLRSLLACAPVLESAAGGAEFILVDDCSDPGRETLPLLRAFRDDAEPASTTVIRFRRQMQYAHGLAYGMSLARGDRGVLFVSQDMVLPPACAAELLAVAAADECIGAVRPTSQHMDWAKPMVQAPPPGTARTFGDLAAFAEQVRATRGGEAVDWPMLIGDAMLVTRALIDRIGVFDTRFYAYMADVDYGIRLHRAGFRHVIAPGAWLHHEGEGTAKETAATGGATMPEYSRRMLAEVAAAYEQFRQKWGGENLPPTFREMKRHHFEALHARPAELPGDAVQPPLQLSDDVAEVF